MLAHRALSAIFQGRLEEARKNNQPRGAGLLAGLTEFNRLLGLNTDPRTGAPMVPLDDRGLPYLYEARERSRGIGLRPLAESIMGREFVEEYYHPSGGFSFGLLREAAIDPTAFQNINTFNLATAGLVNAEIMERFNQPQFIGRNLVTVKPTKMNGQKLIAVARIGSYSSNSMNRLPGEQHSEIGFSEAYQTTPETKEKAEKCVVTKEAVFFDLTDQVLEEAGEVGHNLAYQQEKDIASMVIGVTSLASIYNRNGTSVECYQTASPWINDQANPFADQQSVDNARQLFVGMTDPESGKEIEVMGNTILCMPGRELLMRHQIMAANVMYGTQHGANASPIAPLPSSNFPSVWTKGGNFLSGGTGPWTGPYTIINVGPIWYNMMLATAANGGLALAASAAIKYWYIGDFNRAFWWMENWPLTPWMASADELYMKDRGIVAIYGANYRGAGYVREPRYAVRNKDA